MKNILKILTLSIFIFSFCTIFVSAQENTTDMDLEELQAIEEVNYIKEAQAINEQIEKENNEKWATIQKAVEENDLSTLEKFRVDDSYFLDDVKRHQELISGEENTGIDQSYLNKISSNFDDIYRIMKFLSVMIIVQSLLIVYLFYLIFKQG